MLSFACAVLNGVFFIVVFCCWDSLVRVMYTFVVVYC